MATLTDVGGLPGIGTGFLQPKQKNKWRVRFLGFGDGADSNVMSMQASKITAHTLTFQKHDMHRYNSRAAIAGKHEFSNMELTVTDDLGSGAAMVIQQHLQRQQYLIGAAGPYLAAAQEGSMYKFATILDTLNGNDLVTESWTYEGCWIVDHKQDELDYSSSDIVSINLTLSVDHAYQTFPNAAVPGQALGGYGVY